MREYTKTHINHLEANEIFVFGSNAEGFHGAGSAGMACRGEGKNTWRDDEWFREALKTPLDSSERIGALGGFRMCAGLSKRAFWS